MALGLQFSRRPSPGLIPIPTFAESLITQATPLNDVTPTFTRASTAYDPYNRVTVASGARRRRPFPLSRTLTVYADLIETSRTNLCPQSQTIDSAWTAASTTMTGGVVAPDGTSTASRLLRASAVANCYVTSPTNGTLTAARVYSTSIYFKAATQSVNVGLRLQGAYPNRCDVVFNATTGAVVFSAASGTWTSVIANAADSIGNGWYRGTVTATCGTADAGAVVIVGPTPDNTAGWEGVFASTADVYLWGAQSEIMAASATSGFASSYIATTTVAVTRAADALSVPYVLGQTGTILALCIPYGWTGDQDGVTIYEAFRANDAGASRLSRTNATVITAARADAGGLRTSYVTHGFTSLSLTHLGMTWDATALRGYVAGVAVTPDTTVVLPYQSNTSLVIGNSGGASSHFSGWVALLAWPRALSASELLALYTAFPQAA